ncbi:molybdenum cofactor cytidylyltransferase [Azospirillaceae bacterium]
MFPVVRARNESSSLIREAIGSEMIPAALILAAGMSRRTAPMNKLLHPVSFDSRVPMLAAVVDRFLATVARPLVVVVGKNADNIRDALDGRPVSFAINPFPEEGLSGSIRVGLAALPAEAPAVLIGLGDMPLISSKTIMRLISLYQTHPEAHIVAPVYRGRRGHPVLWDRRFFPALTALTGDRGGRDLINRHLGSLRLAPIEDSGVVTDFDSLDDFQQHATFSDKIFVDTDVVKENHDPRQEQSR